MTEAERWERALAATVGNEQRLEVWKRIVRRRPKSIGPGETVLVFRDDSVLAHTSDRPELHAMDPRKRADLARLLCSQHGEVRAWAIQLLGRLS